MKQQICHHEKYISKSELAKLAKKYDEKYKGITIKLAYAAGFCKGLKIAEEKYKKWLSIE